MEIRGPRGRRLVAVLCVNSTSSCCACWPFRSQIFVVLYLFVWSVLKSSSRPAAVCLHALLIAPSRPCLAGERGAQHLVAGRDGERVLQDDAGDGGLPTGGGEVGGPQG